MTVSAYACRKWWGSHLSEAFRCRSEAREAYESSVVLRSLFRPIRHARIEANVLNKALTENAVIDN